MKRHRAPYQSGNPKEVMRQVDQYGPDFRNPFGHTPLMLAAFAGNVGLLEGLLARGADVELTDNHGRLAFHHALLRALTDEQYARGPFERVYAILAPPALDLRSTPAGQAGRAPDRVLRVQRDARAVPASAELPALVAGGLKVDDLLIPVQSFPASVLPQRSRRRGYLSGVLSRNELTRDYAYNRRLFARTAHGYYVQPGRGAARRRGLGAPLRPPPPAAARSAHAACAPASRRSSPSMPATQSIRKRR